jgi:hypothetical protein
MRRTIPVLLALFLCVAWGGAPAGSYPLDAYPETGMIRLEAYRLAAQGTARPDFLTEGEMLPSMAITLSLADTPGFTIPSPDPELSGRLKDIIGGDARHYGVTVLDYTDPRRPRYASHNGDREQNPGSVGKIMVLLAWFQALADIYPDDVAARARLLREATITADAFIRKDSHKVPKWTWGQSSVDRVPIEEGDTANVYTFLDWMASASSNAAAAMLMKELILLKHFGKDYPVPKAEADAWLKSTRKAELGRIFKAAMQEPLARNGIDSAKLRQGAFFTREGKNRVPASSGSTSTAGELMKYMVQMEKGELVDPWSSREIKKLLYLTDGRIRYAASPVLDDSAVYFKSGSLYGCKPEKGYECGKFLGNRINYMNSMVIIESHDRDPQIRYAVVVLSNVLRKNSSEVHQEMGARIHEIIRGFHPERATAPMDASPGTEPATP